jgi:hypothetical protein
MAKTSIPSKSWARRLAETVVSLKLNTIFH